MYYPMASFSSKLPVIVLISSLLFHSFQAYSVLAFMVLYCILYQSSLCHFLFGIHVKCVCVCLYTPVLIYGYTINVIEIDASKILACTNACASHTCTLMHIGAHMHTYAHTHISTHAYVHRH